ncbi:MAG: glycosyltransferase family 2 protein [Planctomycetaceae bacterium]|nr:glycosyltransferase family 2 protein [Planctomycetaceae bacterium]
MPTVSIVLPTYNRANLLAEAITSALQQTWDKLEVLVVDDGSTDHTVDVVRDLARRDERVHYFYQENAGVSEARNRALNMMSGQLVAFLDSDDVWLPWKLEAQVALLTARPEIGMCWTNMDAITPTGELKEKNFLRHMYGAYQWFEGQEIFAEKRSLGDCCTGSLAPELQQIEVQSGSIYRQMFYGNLVHTPTVVLRREWAQQVGSFDRSMRRGGEDFKYHLATCRLGEVAYLDAASILYRVGNEDQLTKRENNLEFARSYIRTIQEELRYHSEKSGLSDNDIANIRWQAHDWLASEYLIHHYRARSFYHCLKALQHKRNAPGTWRTILKSVLPTAAVRAGKRLLRKDPDARNRVHPIQVDALVVDEENTLNELNSAAGQQNSTAGTPPLVEVPNSVDMVLNSSSMARV